MNQLVVLQEIYASFSKGGDGPQKIDSNAIEGCCPELISKLLESCRRGRIGEDVCRELLSSSRMFMRSNGWAISAAGRAYQTLP